MKKKLQSLWDMKTIVLMQFCDENSDWISPQDGETAKNDVDFFLKQIDLAIEHTQKEGSSG